jgi:hypothetical protein
MKPLWPLRRSWNWARLFRRFRQDALSALSSAVFLCVLMIFALIAGLGRATWRLRRRMLGWPAQGERTMASFAPTGPAANPRRNVLILDSTAARTASANSDTVASQEHQRPNVGEATEKEAANAAVLANLNISLSPPAVLAVAEDAVARRALYWEGLESVFARLIQVDGRMDDVYDLMTICYFEWLYSKPVKRRVIRLIETSQPGAMRWQHMVRHLICFEFDGDSEHPELHPAHKLYFSKSRVRMFFDAEGRFVHWDRPYVGRRSIL